jgi:hypothetical protein
LPIDEKFYSVRKESLAFYRTGDDVLTLAFLEREKNQSESEGNNPD